MRFNRSGLFSTSMPGSVDQEREERPEEDREESDHHVRDDRDREAPAHAMAHQGEHDRAGSASDAKIATKNQVTIVRTSRGARGSARVMKARWQNDPYVSCDRTRRGVDIARHPLRS
jgi:hypothetical protein